MDYAWCILCENESKDPLIKCKSSNTTTLLNHFKKMQTNYTTNPLKPPLHFILHPDIKKQLHEAYLEFILRNKRPENTVDGIGFKKLIESIWKQGMIYT